MSLTRRTPLQRGKHPLRRTSIRRVSSKRAKENRIYSAKRKAFLERNALCQWWLRENGSWSMANEFHYSVESVVTVDGKKCPFATEIHHKAGRTGTNFLDESTWMAVSADGHRWIHDHPSLSRQRGYITK